METDGSRRQLPEPTPQELPGHHVLEYRKAQAEQRQSRSLYSQVHLQGRHQRLMPTYRLPQQSLDITMLDEFGMAIYEQRADTSQALRRWCAGDKDQHVLCVAHANPRNDRVEKHVRREVYVADANSGALSYGRDFRALRQLCRDHDCRSTCVKYVTNTITAAAEEPTKRGDAVACLFFPIPHP